MLMIAFKLLYVIFTIIRDCDSLKSLTIRVPEMAKSGDTVTLTCEYDLEQVALYTIKWYRNEVEFYRYVPKESPPSRAFSVPHIHVDIARSGPTQVTLRGVRREMTGDYKCEVSADAPLFHTEIKTAHMTVAELPNVEPTLHVEPEKVEIGKKVVADCFAPGSDPPANITWYVNYEKVTRGDEEMTLHDTQHDSDRALGLHSSRSRLELVASRSSFAMGPMLIRCETSVFTLWSRFVDGHVNNESPLLASVLGSTQSQTNTLFYNLSENHASSNSSRNARMDIAQFQSRVCALFFFCWFAFFRWT